MIDEKDLENVRKLLKQHDQSHLLAFWAELDQPQRQALLAQVQRFDFSNIDRWVAELVRKNGPAAVPAKFTAAPYYPAIPIGPEHQQKYAQARKLGKELISAGKVAAFVVAGGQGTRLGFDGPKGDFPISPVKNKTLFRIFAETIAAVSAKYATACRWYVMTSPLNHAETVEIFERNDYYGLEHDDVFIFQQGTLPNFSFDGKLLLAERGRIAAAPDGHGGSLKALFLSGAVEDMRERGIEFISYFQVDNPLVKVFDPLFIGLHALDKAEMSSKALEKSGPKEKVGNFCLVNGKVTVIEYSDLPDELAEKRNADGSLVFGLGSIAIHIINRSFVEKLNAEGFSLPLHRAVKEVPHIDAKGNLVASAASKGVKLETFVFDALPLASKSIILRTKRNEEFNPVKDAAGTDSPARAREMMVARAADWLESAGVKVPRKVDGTPDCLLEIAPGFAVEKDDIKRRLNRIPEIQPKDTLYLA
ncbi:MAG: UTP--glucose-1-phosphate uridylyltransferase [Planctomycetota bacterium]|jgi:UDP-N-acetylglucosamine/UDP-N-acetylgalactosamine diphosphorylase